MTTALVRCTQPGCGGMIQDGYCDTCGLAAPSAASSGPSAGVSGPSSGPSGSTGSVGSSSRTRSSRSKGRGAVSGDDLRQADGQLGKLVVDDMRRQQLTIEVLRAALDWCASGRPAGGAPILGCEPNARAVRFGLERSYRALARLTPDETRRIELVDMANAIRPRTLT